MSEHNEGEPRSKKSVFKKLLGIAGVIIGSQMMGPAHAPVNAESSPNSQTQHQEIKEEKIKFPAIKGQVFLKKPDGTIVPYKGMVVALSKQDENDPQAGPSSGGTYRLPAFYPAAEAIANEEGYFLFEEINPGQYIIGEGRENDARRERTIKEAGGFDAHQPIIITTESQLIPGGVTIFQGQLSPVNFSETTKL